MNSRALSTRMERATGRRKASYAIDFGTTNTSIGYCCAEGKTKLLPIEKSSPNPEILRSVLYISPSHKYLFGDSAIEAYIKDVAEGKAKPPKLVWTGKYIPIAKFSPVAGYKGEELVPEIIEVEEGSAGRLIQSLKSALSSSTLKRFNILGDEYSLEGLIGLFLEYLKSEADKITGLNVERLVLGRPVHFVGENDVLAESRLREAAKLAGFEEIKFEYEPVGAAWDFISESREEKQKIFVFDFGGGTLDFSVVSLPQRKIIINYGISIGGDLFNSKIFDGKVAKYFGSESTFGAKHLPLPSFIFDSLRNWYMASLLKTRRFMDSLEELEYLNSDPKALENLEKLVFGNLSFSLYENIDKAKKELSYKDNSVFNFDNQGIKINELVERVEFEKIISEELGEIESAINFTLKSAGLTAEEIDKVVTTGGSSLIPCVKELLSKKFGGKKIYFQDMFTSVASGLALRAKEIF